MCIQENLTLRRFEETMDDRPRSSRGSKEHWIEMMSRQRLLTEGLS